MKSNELTDREWHVLRRRALGEKVEVSALALGVTTHTVKNHLSVIYRKLEVDSLVEALRRVGWLVLPP